MYFRVLFGKVITSFCFSLVIIYHSCVEDTFFNVSCKGSSGIERVGDLFLSPYQYALMGRFAIQRGDGSWYFKPRFDYSNHFWIINIPSWAFIPMSFVIGGGIKTMALVFSEDMQHRYRVLTKPQPIHLNNEAYQAMGLFGEKPISEGQFISQNLPRRPGDEKHLADEKQALSEIGSVLNKAGIFWWADCGTCLGAYRYGGVIPWDFDVDIAILEPDFESVWQLLKQMDPKKYRVFDLSSRERPMSLLRMVILECPEKEIDIYVFKIDPHSKTLNFILSQENHIFMKESWRIRERHFKVPAKFEDVFPLKRASLDGVEVLIPNNIVSYLSRVYGENLDPAKKYNKKTGQYEKDSSHPYWKRPFAH